MTDNFFFSSSSTLVDPTPCAIATLDGIAKASTLNNKATETVLAPTPPETESTSNPTRTATPPETLDSNNMPNDHAQNPTLALATSTASSNNLSTPTHNLTPPTTLVIPNVQPATSVTTAEPMPPGDSEKEDNDVIMENPDLNDSPVPEPRLPQNDNNLPTWLTPNIEYLWSVSKENEWQNLVNEFFTFEKSGPPTGVSFIELKFCNCDV